MLIIQSLESKIKHRDFQATSIVEENLDSNKCNKDYKDGHNGMGDSSADWEGPYWLIWLIDYS